MKTLKKLTKLNYYQISLFHTKKNSRIYENLIDLYQNNEFNDTIDFRDIFLAIRGFGGFNIIF